VNLDPSVTALPYEPGVDVRDYLIIEDIMKNLFLAAAVFNRFLLPQIHVLSKVDLLPPEQIDAILDWSEDEEYLQTAIETQLTAQKKLLSRGVLQAIMDVGLTFGLIPVSAKAQSGLVDLYSELTRIFTGGEELI